MRAKPSASIVALLRHRLPCLLLGGCLLAALSLGAAAQDAERQPGSTKEFSIFWWLDDADEDVTGDTEGSEPDVVPEASTDETETVVDPLPPTAETELEVEAVEAPPEDAETPEADAPPSGPIVLEDSLPEQPDPAFPPIAAPPPPPVVAEPLEEPGTIEIPAPETGEEPELALPSDLQPTTPETGESAPEGISVEALPPPRDMKQPLILPKFQTSEEFPEAPATPSINTSLAPNAKVPSPDEAGSGGSAGGGSTIDDALGEMMRLNPVVARVADEEITWAEVIESAGDLPLKSQVQVESLFPALLDRMIDLKLVAQAARLQGLHRDPEIAEQVRRYEENLIRERFVRNHLDGAIQETAVEARYAKLVKAVGSKQQIRARHILVDSEAAAAGLITALEEGAEFVLLAQQYSKGPSAARGGDLGYFDPSRMVPEFSNAALALEIGAYSRTPVNSPFGWHVIQLLDHRIEGVPPLAEVRENLIEQLTKEALDDLLSGLRRDSEFELFPPEAPPALSGAQPGADDAQVDSVATEFLPEAVPLAPSEVPDAPASDTPVSEAPAAAVPESDETAASAEEAETLPPASDAPISLLPSNEE